MNLQPIEPKGVDFSQFEVGESMIGPLDPPTFAWVLEIGSAVTIGDKKDRIEGTVLGVCVYAKGIEYLVSWWKGRERVSEWLKENEVQSDKPPAAKIGFAAN